MKFMIHRLHGGEALHTAYGTDYRFGNTSFSGVRYPAPLQNCSMCHQGGSENVKEGGQWKASVNSSGYAMNPMPHNTAACYGCHDTSAMLSHARNNTSNFGESCLVCHSSGAEFAPTKEHASEITVSRDQAGK
jgi:OmcA/MtrC family decaheme c-type cytochrome